MKKQKLTRKSLDELAKTMPVLSEDEQRECIGGAFYYSPSGVFLGKVGDSSEIRVTEASTYNTHRWNPDTLTDLSSSLKENSAGVKQAIFDTMGKSMGIKNGVTVYTPLNGNYYEAGRNTPDSGIQLNVSGLLYNQCNYYDFMMVLVHENNHRLTPYNSTQTTESEFEAYLEEYYHPDFQYASEEYRRLVEKRLEELRKIPKSNP